MVESLSNYRITDHAAFEMDRRGVSEDIVRRIMRAPEQRYSVRPGRDVLQSKVTFSGRLYLVRIFVDVDRQPAQLVTVYRTSNMAKYWRRET